MFEVDDKRDRLFREFNIYVFRLKDYSKHLDAIVNSGTELDGIDMAAFKNIKGYIKTQESAYRFINDEFQPLVEKGEDKEYYPMSLYKKGYEDVRIRTANY